MIFFFVYGTEMDQWLFMAHLLFCWHDFAQLCESTQWKILHGNDDELNMCVDHAVLSS
jgi:hypothetical protein